MELSFQKIDGQWVAEFEATSDFNINLDRVGKGALVIYQKGSKDGTYASQASYRNIKDSENVDADVTALVYPKYIKVVSQTEVVKGIVTMNGGNNTSEGAKIVPLINQCRVTWCNYGGDVHADGVELTPDENGVFTIDYLDNGVVRVFSPFLYIPEIANKIEYWQSGYTTWNKNKQCFDISIECLTNPFTLSIIE